MKPLASPWAALDQRICAHEPMFLAFDYDGTLVPIVEDPAQAVLPFETRRLIARLARQPGIRIGIVSGRSLDDLKRIVAVDDVWYVGNHGFEIEDGSVRYIHPMALLARPVLKRMAADLGQAAQRVSGAWVEDKRWTLTLHDRAVSAQSRKRWKREIAHATDLYHHWKLVRITRGNRALEVRPPARWDKGEAIAWLARRFGASMNQAPFPIVYFGDDWTDEDAFNKVNQMQGMSILVGQPLRASAAQWWAQDPSEVQAALTQILDKRCRTT